MENPYPITALSVWHGPTVFSDRPCAASQVEPEGEMETGVHPLSTV